MTLMTQTCHYIDITLTLQFNGNHQPQVEKRFASVGVSDLIDSIKEKDAKTHKMKNISKVYTDYPFLKHIIVLHAMIYW